MSEKSPRRPELSGFITLQSRDWTDADVYGILLVFVPYVDNEDACKTLNANFLMVK